MKYTLNSTQRYDGKVYKKGDVLFVRTACARIRQWIRAGVVTILGVDKKIEAQKKEVVAEVKAEEKAINSEVKAVNAEVKKIADDPAVGLLGKMFGKRDKR